MISELKSIRRQRMKLTERERELTTPKLTDLSLLERIYGWFNESYGKDLSSNGECLLRRKKFLFIALLLYSPGTLAGDRMRIGLRDRLCEVMGIGKGSTLSKSLGNIALYYRIYKYFREDIDTAYSYVMERLEDEGIVRAKPD